MNFVLDVHHTTLLSSTGFEVMNVYVSSSHNATGGDADGFALLKDSFSGCDRAE